MFNRPLLLTAGILIALLVVASFALYKQIQTNGALSASIEAKEAEIANKQAVIDRERTNAQDAANRSLAARIEESNREEELNKLRQCVANKSCGVQLRYQSCTTSGMSTASASRSKPISAPAWSEREFQQWFLDHSGLIDRYEVRVKELQEDVKARSAPDYCQPKKSPN